MSKQKTTAKPRANAMQSRKADSARELAELISAVLMHPDTPVCVYNALADAVSDLFIPRNFIDGPDYIEVVLRNYLEEKGGAR